MDKKYSGHNADKVTHTKGSQGIKKQLQLAFPVFPSSNSSLIERTEKEYNNRLFQQIKIEEDRD